MIEKPTNTASSTASRRGTRQDCSRMTKGASTKLKSTASATGTRISRAKYRPVTISPATARLISAVPLGRCSSIGGSVSANRRNPRRSMQTSVKSGRSRGKSGHNRWMPEWFLEVCNEVSRREE